MSTRYNTGSPIESTDVRDMSDNAKNFDDFANSKSNEFTDRFGVERKTIHGMNSQFDSHILNMGFTRVGTFAAGATLTNPRQTLLWDIADGGDGQEYGWSGSFPLSGKVVPPGSTPASTGGISVGAWISRFDPELKVQVREALRRSYAEAGYNLVDGSFQAGGAVETATDVLLDEVNSIAYSWGGVLPKPIPVGSTPSSSGGIGAGAWQPQSSDTLRIHLAAIGGAGLVGVGTYAGVRSYAGPSTRIDVVGRAHVFDGAHGIFIVDANDTISADNDGTVLIDMLGRRWKRQYSGNVAVEWFGAVGDFNGTSGTDDTSAFIAAFAYITSIGGGAVEATAGKRYRLTHTVFYGSNFVFNGNGCEVFHDSNTANGSAFMPEKFQHATLKNKNIVFENFILNTKSGGGNGIAGANARNVKIQNVTSDYIFWHLFDGAGCQDFGLYNCASYSCATSPYQCDNATYANASEASDSAGNILPIAFDATGGLGASNNVIISGCRAVTTVMAAIHLHNKNNDNIIIDQCIFENCYAGVMDDTGSTIINRGISITNCKFIRCNIPIIIQGDVGSLNVSGNYFFGDNIDDFYYGIRIYSDIAAIRYQVSITNNQFVGIIRPVVANEVRNISVSGNSFNECGGTTPPSTAASVESPNSSSIVALNGCTEGQVTSNIFTHCLRPSCVSIDNTTSINSDNILVSGNITRASGALISSHDADRLSIIENKYVGLAGDTHAVYISGGVEPHVANNKIYCGGGSGITVTDSTLPQISDNILRSAVETGVPVMIRNTTVVHTSKNIVISGFTGPQILLNGTSTGVLIDEPFATVGKADSATGTKVTYATEAV